MDFDNLLKNLTKENIDLYLANGGDINAKCPEGANVLQHFVGELERDDTEIVRFLFEKGLDINATDNNGNTVLHFAVESRLFNVTRLLLEYGADIVVENKHGDTPLYYAMLNNDKEMEKLLIDKGVSLDIDISLMRKNSLADLSTSINYIQTLKETADVLVNLIEGLNIQLKNIVSETNRFQTAMEEIKNN